MTDIQFIFTILIFGAIFLYLADLLANILLFGFPWSDVPKSEVVEQLTNAQLNRIDNRLLSLEKGFIAPLPFPNLCRIGKYYYHNTESHNCTIIPSGEVQDMVVLKYMELEK